MVISAESSQQVASTSPHGAYHGLRMTEEEYLALPVEKPGLEYIDGMVIQKPMGDANHSDLTVEISALLRAYGKRRGGRAGVERRARFAPSGNFRLPDVCFFRAGASANEDDVPTLAVEIRSEGQTRNELRAKCRFFLANGVDEGWLVDPRLRTVEQFSSEGEFILGADQTLVSNALPGFELVLAELFAVLEPEA